MCKLKKPLLVRCTILLPTEHVLLEAHVLILLLGEHVLILLLGEHMPMEQHMLAALVGSSPSDQQN